MSRVIALAVICLVLTACSTPSGQDGPDYQPVPDTTLFDRGARVPGVRSADLTYSSTLGDKGYVGQVRLDPALTRAQAGTAISTVYAILRQGRYRQTIYLEPIQDGKVLRDLPGVPDTGVVDELDRLYGPQPGDGTPPSP